MKIEELYKINKLCRKYNIKFIYTLSMGLCGFAFNDFGKEFEVKDCNGEKNLKYNIFGIEENEDTYEIFLDLQNDEKFELIKGDLVKFKNIKGLEFLNDGEPKKILKSHISSFEIEKNNNVKGKYISDGIVEEIKTTKALNFETFQNNFIKFKNNYINIDSKKKSSNVLLHCAFVGLHFYYTIYNKLPELNNLKQVDEIIELSKKYYLIIKQKYIDYSLIKKKKIIEFDEHYIQNVLRWCKSEINPVCTFLGGIVSQEALKITGKYNPIYQWLRFDFFETIEKIPLNAKRKLLNCRYDDQIAIFGQELQEKLENLNVFMVGAGALGCEYIKNFALMGISSGKGKLSITDNDIISLSNLNRQFLFHKNDINGNNYKSFVAKREAMKINNKMKIEHFQLLINKDTRDNDFHDKFFNSQDIIISAVDNINARKYIDKLCTFFDKILIDSGTEGTKANSDIYLPNKTICLNDSEFVEKQEIPDCTLKSFPTKIEHCIKFAKNEFEELFGLDIKNLQLLIKNKKKFDEILDENSKELFFTIEKYRNIFYIIENPSEYLIIKYALFIYQYYFEFKINKLLEDKSNTNNKLPSPLKVNLNDNNTILFFESFFYIISDIINFNQSFHKEELSILISKEKNSFNHNYNDQELTNNFNKGILNKINENKNIKEKIEKMKIIELEKDNDENYHINFILSFSNLRANNYNIENTEFIKVKEIAGNIIPAIASTTSSITGLACLQIYTLLQSDERKLFKNSAFNLATCEFDLYTPEEKRYITDSPKTERNNEIKVIPKEYTCWDKLDIIGPNKTIKSFIDDFRKNYGVNIDFINYNGEELSSPFLGDENLDKTIEELIKEKYNKQLNKNNKYIQLEILTSSLDNDDTIIYTPTIRYILK